MHFFDYKTILAVKLSIPASFALISFESFVEKYIWSDWEFIWSFCALIALDTIVGFLKNWKAGTLSSAEFANLFYKVIVYAAVLVTVHNVTHYKTDGEVDGIFGWLDSVFYAAFMVREALSIFENLKYLYPKVVPLWILKRLKSFDETGNINSNNDE